MTDSPSAMESAALSNAPPLIDDQLVYVPLEQLPKDLLSKLDDFKVIVKDDKAGDRILPKERLGEVLRSLKHGESLLPAGGQRTRDEQLEFHPTASPSPDTTLLRTSSPPTSRQRNSESAYYVSQRRFENCRTSMARDFSGESVLPSDRYRNIKCQPSSNPLEDSGDFYSPNKTSDVPKSPMLSMSFSKNNYPSLFAETILGRQSLRENSHHDMVQTDDFPESEPIYGFGTNSRVSMDTVHQHQRFLETTPRKTSYPDSTLADISLRQSPRRQDIESYRFGTETRCRRNLPSPTELSRTMQNAEVSRARKQLFQSPRLPYDSYLDENEFQKENYFRYSRSPRDLHQRDYTVMEGIPGSPRKVPMRACHPLISERGLKRKYYPEDDESYLQAGPSENVRMTSSGIADRLLEGLHPSKRPCYDIGPAEKMDCQVKCSCSMMESHFLEMTEGAYKNIRRKDSTSASFEQFRKELIETNSVLKESVSILRAIQQICSHKEGRSR